METTFVARHGRMFMNCGYLGRFDGENSDVLLTSTQEALVAFTEALVAALPRDLLPITDDLDDGPLPEDSPVEMRWQSGFDLTIPFWERRSMTLEQFRSRYLDAGGRAVAHAIVSHSGSGSGGVLITKDGWLPSMAARGILHQDGVSVRIVEVEDIASDSFMIRFDVYYDFR